MLSLPDGSLLIHRSPRRKAETFSRGSKDCRRHLTIALERIFTRRTRCRKLFGQRGRVKTAQRYPLGRSYCLMNIDVDSLTDIIEKVLLGKQISEGPIHYRMNESLIDVIAGGF